MDKIKIKEEIVDLSKIRRLKASHRVLFPTLAIVLALILVGGGVAIAAWSLNQSVGVTVTISQPPGGGSGGTPPPTAGIALYTDSAFSSVLSTLTFNYIVGGNSTVTTYLKTVEVGTENITATVTQPSGASWNGTIVLSAVVGADSAGARPVTITASGGPSGVFTGSASFAASGSSP